VDGVGEEGDGPGRDDDRGLQDRRHTEHDEAGAYGADAVRARLERRVGRLRRVVAVRADQVQEAPEQAVLVVVLVPVIVVVPDVVVVPGGSGVAVVVHRALVGVHPPIVTAGTGEVEATRARG
jgi:hypothetical protein